MPLGEQITPQDQPQDEAKARSRAAKMSPKERERKDVAEPEDDLEAGARIEPRDDGIDATQAAEALAVEQNVDLAGVSGSGRKGRIVKGDVQKAMGDDPAFDPNVEGGQHDGLEHDLQKEDLLPLSKEERGQQEAFDREAARQERAAEGR